MNNMKETIKEIFNKKNMKIIIPLIVLLALLIVTFIYLREYQYNNYRDKRELKLYQYFGTAKTEYEAIVSYNKKEVIKSFSPKEYKINYESIPIYLQEEEKEENKENKNGTVIFPSEMALLLPIKGKTEYKIPEFSYVKQKNDIHYLTYEDYHRNIDHYVLFDGENLYFFSDSVTFKIKDEEITLSPLSYIIDSGIYFSYYDYETDTYKEYEYTDIVTVSNKYYEINTSHDYIEYFGNNLLLTSDLSYLNYMKEQ